MTLLDPASRAWLAALADQLIPEDADMPAASGVNVAEAGADGVLAARPDLVEPLIAALTNTASMDQPAHAVELLRTQHPALFGALTEVVAGAYYLHPEIQRRIGFHGRAAISVERATVDADLLAPVLERGSICRPDPRGAF